MQQKKQPFAAFWVWRGPALTCLPLSDHAVIVQKSPGRFLCAGRDRLHREADQVISIISLIPHSGKDSFSSWGRKKKKVSAALKPSRMRVKCNSGQPHTAVTRHGNCSELRCPALCFHYSVQLSMHCSPSLNKHIAEWLTQRSAETNTVLYLLRVSPAVICFLFSAASTAPWCTFTMGNIPPIHVPICLFFDLVSHAPGSHCEEPKVTDGKQRFPIFWRVIVYFPRASQDRAQVAHSWAPS